MRSFQSTNIDTPTDLVHYWGSLTQNTSQENLTLGKTMIQDSYRYLLQKYYFNETSYTIQTVSNQQKHNFTISIASSSLICESGFSSK